MIKRRILLGLELCAWFLITSGVYDIFTGGNNFIWNLGGTILLFTGFFLGHMRGEECAQVNIYTVDSEEINGLLDEMHAETNPDEEE